MQFDVHRGGFWLKFKAYKIYAFGTLSNLGGFFRSQIQFAGINFRNSCGLTMLTVSHFACRLAIEDNAQTGI
jgi:hypothetical protein